MNPSDQQIAAIGRIADEYKANCRHFSDESHVCSISVLFNDGDLNDKDITVVTTTIYTLNKDNRPLTMTKNFLIETDGTTTDMSEFLTPDQQAEYIAKLTKLTMNK